MDEDSYIGMGALHQAMKEEAERLEASLTELSERSHPNARYFLNPEPEKDYPKHMHPEDVYAELGRLQRRMFFAVKIDDRVYVRSVVPRFEQLALLIPDEELASGTEQVIKMARTYQDNRTSQ